MCPALLPHGQRYDMLLKELLKCTPAEHVDHAGLEEAQACIKDVAMLINERKREAEQQRARYQAARHYIIGTWPSCCCLLIP